MEFSDRWSGTQSGVSTVSAERRTVNQKKKKKGQFRSSLNTLSKIKKCIVCVSSSAIHSKNLVSIVYLLLALAMYYAAPIRLPEHVSVQVIVVKV